MWKSTTPTKSGSVEKHPRAMSDRARQPGRQDHSTDASMLELTGDAHRVPSLGRHELDRPPEEFRIRYQADWTPVTQWLLHEER